MVPFRFLILIVVVLWVPAPTADAKAKELHFQLADERCLVLAGRMDTTRNVVSYPGDLSRSSCVWRGTSVACNTVGQAGGTTYGGDAVSQTKFGVGEKTPNGVVAVSEGGNIFLTFSADSYHWAQTMLTPAGIMQKQCVGVLTPMAAPK